MPFDFKETTVAAVHRAMLAGEVTCRELAEYYLKRIDAYDQKGPCLNAIILVNPRALEEADRLDAALKNGGLTGPLHGIPVILKDNVDTADMPTTAGSESLRGFTPDEDAFITKRLREAGALILAKSNLHEFAIWGETISSILGQTLNPYDLTRTARARRSPPTSASSASAPIRSTRSVRPPPPAPSWVSAPPSGW